MGIGLQELIVIFLIVLLLFGAKRLPEIARSLGRATNEFKRAKDEILTQDQPTDSSRNQQDGNSSADSQKPESHS